MNRLRTHKFKPSADTEKNNENHTSNSNNSTGNGLFNKLTKRYSTLSSKITRRHVTGRKSQSPQKIVSGSYDMTGANSEDHRLEIGAPVLISTTTLDTDCFGITEARLKQIGGGIAVTNTEFLTTIIAHNITTNQAINEAEPFTHIPSSSSENEIYLDANSESPRIIKTIFSDEEEKYESALETEKQASEKSDDPEPKPRSSASPDSLRKSQSPSITEDNNSSAKESSPELLNTSSKSYDNAVTRRCSEITPLTTLYEFTRSKKSLAKKQHSKSAHNLHRTELRMHLARAPSVALDMNLTTADLNNCHDLPKLPELYGESPKIAESSDADKENSSPSVVLRTKSDPNTPMTPEQRVSGYLSQQQTPNHFKSIDSLDIHRNVVKRRNIGLNLSTNSIDHSSGSKQSLDTSHNSTLDDFNLKSVSCQSLNAHTLFVSIDELNEITRQINESEEFNQEMDLEYCLHRDNLKPNERRITLLKNKNGRLMNLVHNKEKIKKGWNGVKHWIGEESHKIKEVVQKQSTLQRVASSRLNLSLGQAECRSSPSVNGSMSLRANENQRSFKGSKSNVTVMARSADVLDTSCVNITECELEDDGLESSFRGTIGDDNSPVSKRARREVRRVCNKSSFILSTLS